LLIEITKNQRQLSGRKLIAAFREMDLDKNLTFRSVLEKCKLIFWE